MQQYDEHWVAIDNRGEKVGHATRHASSSRIIGHTYNPSARFEADTIEDMRYAFHRVGATSDIKTHEPIHNYLIVTLPRK